MMDWLIDTFIWTGALIALVLLIRRPVARIFGPKLAYALWLLPLIRLLLPPVTLPSWMAPVPEEAGVESGVAWEVPIPTNDIAAPVAPPVEAGVVPIMPDWSAGDILLPVWIGGAIAFLIWRWVDYRRMKDELFAGALPVGESDAVRLIETVAVGSPVAFGVRDKVVALPPGFISSQDTHARDLAIEHELQHHRGGDLLANFAAQAVLALHWFNPLAWAGWRAMRRDQEAACDARVIEQCGREERAAYGQVIAGFAAGPHLALAAPMACPVLGEKSVIHRLRSLNMSDVSTRRRMAGRAALLAGALALPLTASVSYAEDIEDESTSASAATSSGQSSTQSEQEFEVLTTTVSGAEDEDVEVIVLTDDDSEDGKQVHKIIKRHKADGEHTDHDKKVFVWKEEDEEVGEDGKKRKIIKKHVIEGDMSELSEEERTKVHNMLKEMRGGEHGEHHQSKERIRIKIADAEGEMTRVEIECDGDRKPGETETNGDTKTVFICKSEIMASALTGMKAARDQIANELDIPEGTRKEALRSLDAEISRLEEKS